MAAVRQLSWHLGEMFLAMVVVGAATVSLLWLSVIEAGAICAVECGLMIPAMVAAMPLHAGLRARRSIP